MLKLLEYFTINPGFLLISDSGGGEGEDGDGAWTGGGEGADGIAEGGAGGDDVVDDGDVSPGDDVGMCDIEDAGGVGEALGGSVARLGAVSAGAHGVYHGNVASLADGSGEDVGLVVSAAEALEQVHGHRLECVDVAHDARGGEALAPDVPEVADDVWAVVVFAAAYQHGCRGVVAVGEHGSAAVDNAQAWQALAQGRVG